MLLLWLWACTSPQPPPVTASAPSPDQPWNLVIVLSDALRAANVGPWGYPRDTTPALDALAEDSLVFEHGFAGFPGTPQSVSQMLTGRTVPPLLMGAKWFANPIRAIDAEVPILPRLLDQADYRTGLVSSHYWWTDDSRLMAYLDHHVVVRSERSYAPFEALLPHVEEFLDQPGDQPFALLVHSMDTHGPWSDLDPDLDDPNWPEAYSRLDTDVRRTDRGVQALIQALQERGLWDNTVFVFTSDHGDEFGELGPEPWNRNHGLQVRRPLAHVPFLVRLPGNRAAGRYRAPVSLTDLTPTLAGMLAPDIEVGEVDGRDLSKAWLAGQDGDPTEPVFGWSWRYQAAYLPQHELVVDPWTGDTTWSTVAPDSHNYPRLTSAGAPDPALVNRLRQHMATSMARYASAPANPSMAPLSIATLPMQPATSPAPMTFAADPNDGLWSHPGSSLGHGPDEQVPPLTLQMPWAPGAYDVTLTRTPPSTAAGPIALDLNGQSITANPDPKDASRLTLGAHELGRLVTWTFYPHPTGLGLQSIELRPIGADPEEPDPALRQKLEELGYVQPDPRGP